MASIDRSDPVILSHVLAEHRELFCQMMAVRSALADKGTLSPDRVDAMLAALHALRTTSAATSSRKSRGDFSRSRSPGCPGSARPRRRS